MTAAYLFLDLSSKTLRYAAAAHPRLLWLHRASLEVEAVEENGLLIGVMASAAYTAVERSFQRGDRFLLYTDGLLEATDKNEEFYEEGRLKKALVASAGLTAGESADFILRELAEWSGYEAGRAQEDDLTLLVVDVTGE